MESDDYVCRLERVPKVDDNDIIIAAKTLWRRNLLFYCFVNNLHFLQTDNVLYSVFFKESETELPMTIVIVEILSYLLFLKV